MKRILIIIFLVKTIVATETCIEKCTSCQGGQIVEASGGCYCCISGNCNMCSEINSLQVN